MKSSLGKGKLKILSIIFIVFFLLNLGFLVRWQVFNHEKFVALARERIMDNKIPSIRGEILAADGSSLAYSEPRYNVVVYKTELEYAEEHSKQTREEFISKVAGALEIEKEVLEDRINVEGNWLVIENKVSYEVKERLLELKRDNAPDKTLDGIRLEYTSQRIYPEGAMACHVIGFLGKNDLGEDLGRAGLEHYWEGLLKEQVGFDNTEVDSFGNIIALDNVNNVEARRGATIYTTIDKNLQSIADREIQKAVEKYNAKSGSVIIMDPKTGKVMALSNYPSFNPNEYQKVQDSMSFKNVAITDPAELGSVGKAFTMAAALDLDKIEPDTVVIKGHKGCTTVEEAEREWEICTYDKKSQPAMTTTQALVKSDNLALYEISKLIGQQDLQDYLQRFGIGTRTDIDISGESNGVLKDVSQWTNVDTATYSFGHGYQMTQLQAITGIAAIANGGELVRPYIVSKVEESNGDTKDYGPVVVRRVIRQTTADKLTNMLYEVYKSNIPEYQYKDLSKYKIAMKSGTATIPYKDRAGYSKEINASYIGFDASDKSTFIMLVKLEEPKAVERLSFYSARVVWLDIFIQIKDYLGVPEIGG